MGMREIVGTHVHTKSTTVHNLASDCQSLPRLLGIHPTTESVSKTNISWSTSDLDVLLRYGFS